MPYLIYVLHCTGDTLYTGITPDLRRRMRQHCGQLAGGDGGQGGEEACRLSI